MENVGLSPVKQWMLSAVITIKAVKDVCCFVESVLYYSVGL